MLAFDQIPFRGATTDLNESSKLLKGDANYLVLENLDAEMFHMYSANHNWKLVYIEGWSEIRTILFCTI